MDTVGPSEPERMRNHVFKQQDPARLDTFDGIDKEGPLVESRDVMKNVDQGYNGEPASGPLSCCTRNLKLEISGGHSI